MYTAVPTIVTFRQRVEHMIPHTQHGHAYLAFSSRHSLEREQLHGKLASLRLAYSAIINLLMLNKMLPFSVITPDRSQLWYKENAKKHAISTIVLTHKICPKWARRAKRLGEQCFAHY